MNALRIEEIRDKSGEALSADLVSNARTIDPGFLSLPAVLMLLEKLLPLIGRTGLRKRVEHLEQVVKAQQAAINMLINHRTT